MNESELKSQLVRMLKKMAPALVVFRHEDIRTAGIPDMSVTGGGRTTWWEYKFADPDIEDTELQRRTCLLLNRVGFCRYVVWSRTEDGDHTFVMVPGDAGIEAQCVGFSMAWLAAYIYSVHRF